LPVLLALIGGASSPGLFAQEGDSPFSTSFKIGLGLTAGDVQTTHYDNKLIGFAAEVQYKLPMLPNGHYVSAEVAYEYIPSRPHEVTRWDSGLYLSAQWSTDTRKETGQGFSFKFAYGLPCPIVNGLEYFGGLSFDVYSVRSERKWNLRDSSLGGTPGYPLGGNWPMGGPNYIGGVGSYTFFGSRIEPGFFVGAKYRVHEDIGVELALRNLGMRHVDLTPGAYLGQEDFVVDVGSTRGWALVFAVTTRL
jgi:hypothetical protein